MQRIVPGLFLAILLAGLGAALSVAIPGPGTVFFAMVAGLAIGNLLPASIPTAAGLAFTERHLLPVAIALMGTELELHTLGKLGASGVLVVIPAVATSILCALPIGRLLKLPMPASLILGIGNSVCGSSAVLAAAPAVQGEKQDVAVAIAAVNLAGTIGVFLLPVFASALHLSSLETAYLLGGSLQAVGQVVAAGFSVSDAVGNDALVIKMLRVLMIGPIVIVLHGIFKSKNASRGQKKRYVPGYILGFVACAVGASFFEDHSLVLHRTKQLASLLMAVSMAAIGARIHLRSLLQQGPKAALLVTSLSIIQTSLILGLSTWLT